MADWYIYLIRCRDGSLYTGITTDVARRLDAHRKGSGASYLRGRAPLKLVFQRKLGDRSLALAVEHRVKRLTKVKKEELVRTGKYLDGIIAQAGKKD